MHSESQTKINSNINKHKRLLKKSKRCNSRNTYAYITYNSCRLDILFKICRSIFCYVFLFSYRLSVYNSICSNICRISPSSRSRLLRCCLIIVTELSSCFRSSYSFSAERAAYASSTISFPHFEQIIIHSPFK